MTSTMVRWLVRFGSWRMTCWQVFATGMVVVGVALAGTVALYGTDSGAGSIGSAELAHVGLQRQWFTQASTASRTPEPIQWTLAVSAGPGKTVFEVVSSARAVQITDRDVDSRGNRLNVEGAQRKAALLVERWQRRGLSAEMTQRHVPDVHLYVMNPTGILECFDAESGTRLWEALVGSSGHPIFPPAVSAKYVAVVHGTRVILLDRYTGKTEWTKRCEGVPGAGAGLSRTMLFAPMHDGTMEYYSTENPQQPMQVYRSLGHPTAAPVVTRFTAAWPTDKGHLYVVGSESTRVLFRVEATRTIDVAPAYDDGKYFVPSADGYLYCVHERTGSILWTFSTGERLEQTPMVIDDSIYLVTADRNLYHIGATTVDLRWIVSRVGQLLAISGDRLYCASATGQLVVIDRKSGSRLYETASVLPPVRMSNGVTDRIYICSDSGAMECWRPVDAKYPTIYVEPVQEEKEDTQEAPEGTPPMSMPAVPERPAPIGGEDPFAPPGGRNTNRTTADDPFAPGRP